MDRLLVDQRSTRTATLFSLLFIFLNLTGETLQFPGGFQEKRFNVEAVPSKNGQILLHLKGRNGERGADGLMGDKGPSGIPGPPGPKGEKGPSGACSPQLCDAIQQASSLLSRVTNLEQLVNSRGLLFDQPTIRSAVGPIVLHITSDILLTSSNISNGGDNRSGLPRNINLNIALKNGDIQEGGAPSVAGAPKRASFRHRGAGKFLINSTVFLEQRSKIKGSKNGFSSAPDGETTTEKQLHQKVVPSIKKNRIPHQ